MLAYHQGLYLQIPGGSICRKKGCWGGGGKISHIKDGGGFGLGKKLRGAVGRGTPLPRGGRGALAGQTRLCKLNG